MGRWSAMRGALVKWATLGLVVGTLGACAPEPLGEAGADQSRSQAESELAAAVAADALTASRVQAVRPVLRCVDALAGNHFRAHFGYTNSGSALSIPIGSFNHFVPAPAGRGQPTTFAPGSAADVVQVQFAGSGSLTWVLGTRMATATRSSSRCPAGGTGGTGVGGMGVGGMGVGGTGVGGTGVGGMGTGGSPVCPSSCDDFNPCTSDTCGPATGFSCAHAPAADGSICDDGNACTTGDSCQGGQCAAGTATVCPATTESCRVAACDPASGACIAVPASNGTACSNGAFCTVNESCTDGVCGGGMPRVCPASAPDLPCEIPHCFPDDGMGFGGFCFFEPSLPLTPCTTIDGRPGLCNGIGPSICSPLDP